MGYRDELEAALARAKALERELKDAKRENAALRDEVLTFVERQRASESDQQLALPSLATGEREPSQAVDNTRRAQRASLLMVFSLVGALASSWAIDLGLGPLWLLPLLLPLTVSLLGLFAFGLLRSLLLTHRARADEGGSARAPVVALVVAVVFLPVIGSLAALLALVLPRRGTGASGAGAAGKGPSHDALEQLEASIVLTLAIAWPFLLVSLVLCARGLADPTRLMTVERLEGRVASSSGDLPMPPGARCEVEVTPTGGARRDWRLCRVVILCDEDALYQGAADCVVRDRLLRRASFAGEPSLHLDVAAGYGRVWDEGVRPFDVTFTVAVER